MRVRHGIVSGIIMTPHFRQASAPPTKHNVACALARSFRFRIPQPPAPRGRQDRAYSLLPTSKDAIEGPTKVGPFAFGGIPTPRPTFASSGGELVASCGCEELRQSLDLSAASNRRWLRRPAERNPNSRFSDRRQSQRRPREAPTPQRACKSGRGIGSNVSEVRYRRRRAWGRDGLASRPARRRRRHPRPHGRSCR